MKSIFDANLQLSTTEKRLIALQLTKSFTWIETKNSFQENHELNLVQKISAAEYNSN